MSKHETPVGEEPTVDATDETPKTEPTTLAATTAPQVKPLVTYDVASAQLHLVPGGRHILVSKKTLAVKLPRDPALELDDPNVRLVLAMAAGPDMRDAIAAHDGAKPIELVYAYNRALGNT